MPPILKSILKYTITLALGIFLLWYVLKGEDLEKISSDFKGADYTWIALTIIISLISHLSRAYRWNLLMKPLGYAPSLLRTFCAVMVGYFANIFAPRMGEVVRCAILTRTDKVPLNVSFGTVVAERAFDFICLLTLISLALLLEFQRISDFFFNLFSERINSLENSLKNFYLYIFIFIIVIITASYFSYKNRDKLKEKTAFIKIRNFIYGIWQGILSIKKLENKGAFLLHTFFIWGCYYLMTYLAFFSLSATSGLGLTTGLVILVVGGLGMSAPVQAGIGAFHFFVKEALFLYDIPRTDGLSYAFIVHTSQSLAVLFVGCICFFITLNFSKKVKPETKLESLHANI